MILLDRSVAELQKRIRAQENENRKIVRLQVATGPLDLPAWLQAQPLFPKIYWHSRDGLREYAGLGSAHFVNAGTEWNLRQMISAMNTRLQESGSAQSRFFGGIKFDPAAPAGELWEEFGKALFILPRIEICREVDQYFLACHLNTSESADHQQEKQVCLQQLRNLVTPNGRPANNAVLRIQSRRNLPNKSQWQQAV
ncbi:MAG: hypothetical protein WAN36_02145, partial [Calditrichia bacterium]